GRCLRAGLRPRPGAAGRGGAAPRRALQPPAGPAGAGGEGAGGAVRGVQPGAAVAGAGVRLPGHVDVPGRRGGGGGRHAAVGLLLPRPGGAERVRARPGPPAGVGLVPARVPRPRPRPPRHLPRGLRRPRRRLRVPLRQHAAHPARRRPGPRPQRRHRRGRAPAHHRRRLGARVAEPVHPHEPGGQARVRPRV
ncbi:hypothetical protein VTH06DRAFT_2895, partial [Thermothelomyces fergusii]